MKKNNFLLKKQALNHFKKVKVAKVNKKRILEILSKIDYTVDFNDIRYENGYFIFSFPENSIAYFFIKEFPDWKFGIWLDEYDKFSIFGEAIVLIDKFKPSASTLSFNNVLDFNKELSRVLNNQGYWKKYSETLQKRKIAIDINNKYNKKIFDKINAYIQKVRKEYKDNKVDTYIQLIDNNTEKFKVLPRYSLNELTNIEGYFENPNYLERTKKIFTDLCNLFEYTGNYCEDCNAQKKLDIDNYLFENLIIINPRDYEEKANYFKWKTDLKFEDYIKKLH